MGTKPTYKVTCNQKIPMDSEVKIKDTTWEPSLHIYSHMLSEDSYRFWGQYFKDKVIYMDISAENAISIFT